MKDFFRRNGIWVVVAALLLTAALSLGSALFPNLTSPLSNVIGIVASPFQKATTSFTGWVESLYDYAFRYQELQSKVEELELQISEMNKDNREAEDAVAENARLRKLLKLAEKHTDFTYEAARVTGATSTSWESTITLSKGSSSGIEKTTPSSPKPATWWAWWRSWAPTGVPSSPWWTRTSPWAPWSTGPVTTPFWRVT